jgi:hypothetical protein
LGRLGATALTAATACLWRWLTLARTGPRGSGRCTQCGAEGVNRATCTGSKDTHEALAKGYKGPHLNTGNGAGPTSYEKEYEEVVEELTPDQTPIEQLEAALDLEEDDIPFDEEEESDHVPDIPFEVQYTPPRRPGVFVVNFRVITRMPASCEQHLVDIVHGMADVIHLDTEFEELQYE